MRLSRAMLLLSSFLTVLAGRDVTRRMHDRYVQEFDSLRTRICPDCLALCAEPWARPSSTDAKLVQRIKSELAKHRPIRNKSDCPRHCSGILNQLTREALWVAVRKKIAATTDPSKIIVLTQMAEQGDTMIAKYDCYERGPSQSTTTLAPADAEEQAPASAGVDSDDTTKQGEDGESTSSPPQQQQLFSSTTTTTVPAEPRLPFVSRWMTDARMHLAQRVRHVRTTVSRVMRAAKASAGTMAAPGRLRAGAFTL